MGKKSVLKIDEIKINPYNTGAEARGDNFFDREDILLGVKKFINNENEYNLTIFGQRRIGKTSVLRKIQEQYSFIDAIYFNLQDKSRVPIKELIEEIADKIKLELDLKLEIDKKQIKGKKAKEYFADTFLKQVFDEKEKKLVLLFDEFDTIGDLEKIEKDPKINELAYNQFINFISSIIEKIKKYRFPLKFIFAIGRNYKDLELERYGQILKFGPQFELTCFAKRDCIEFISKTSKNYIKFEDNALQYLYQITNGHPLFSICIASMASEHAIDNKKSIVDRQDIDKMFEPSLKQYSYSVYWIFDSLLNKEKIILYIIALLNEENIIADFTSIENKAKEKNLMPATAGLEKTIDRLRKFNFIFCIEYGYKFYVEFIRKWILTQNTDEDFEKFLVEDKTDDEIDFYITNARYFFYNKRNFLKAAEYYEKILEYYPYHFEALINCAKSYEQQTQKDKKFFELAFAKYKEAYKSNVVKTGQDYSSFLYSYLNYAETIEDRELILEILYELNYIEKEDFRDAQRLVEELIIADRQDFEKICFEKIYNYKKITELRLSNKELNRLPEDIGDFENLERLDIRDNNINELPVGIFKLEKLKELLLAGNTLSIYDGFILEDVNSVFDFFTIKKIENELRVKLEKKERIKWNSRGYVLNQDGRVSGLSLYKCEIKKLDIVILYLKNINNLNSINLSENVISDISPLKDLNQLTELNLSENVISDISPLKILNKLTLLDLSSNKISDISPLKILDQLTELYLSYNKISDISPLKILNKLTKLYLSYNKISDVSSLKHLNSITSLYLRNNNITNISFIKDLKGLASVNLARNSIKKIPEWLTKKNLKIEIDEEFTHNCINLYGNPIEIPPLEIVKQGNNSIRDYLKSLEDRDNIKLYEVKVLLVGEGMAGKTSLLKSLQGEKFDKNESQTHGINVVSLESNKIKGLLEENEELKDCKLHFWDFGGQEIMHASHQFFLSKRSLYILVLDSRTDSRKYYWLKHIEKYGGNSPVIVVMNKIDENASYNIQQKEINEKFPSIANRFHRISCKTGDGIDELVKTLAETIPKTDLFGTVISQTWMNVKNILVQETKENRYISRERFIQICDNQQKQIDSSSRQTLLKYLNDLGIVLYFERLKLKNIYVLDPHWVTIGVYKIINSGKIKNGILKEEDLTYILNEEEIKKEEYDPAKDKNITYEQNEMRYLIDIMIQFELCYEYEKHEGHYIIPDLLPKDAPTNEPKLEGESPICFIMKYDYLPASIISRLMLRLKNDINLEFRWKYGMLLENNEFNCKAKVKADEQENTVAITVEGDKRRKREYFSIIRHTIADINKDFENLKVEEFIPLPGYPKTLVKYKFLLGYEKMGVNKYIDGELGKPFLVSELLDSVIERKERDKDHAMIQIIKGDKVEGDKLINGDEVKGDKITNITYNIQNIINIMPNMQDDMLDATADPKEKAALKKELEKVNTALNELALLEKNRDKEKVKQSSAMDRLKRFIGKFANTGTRVGKALKMVEDGIDYAQDIAGYYNKIAQWCGLPQVPKPFLKT